MVTRGKWITCQLGRVVPVQSVGLPLERLLLPQCSRGWTWGCSSQTYLETDRWRARRSSRSTSSARRLLRKPWSRASQSFQIRDCQADRKCPEFHAVLLSVRKQFCGL